MATQFWISIGAGNSLLPDVAPSHFLTISQDVSKIPIYNMSLKITLLKLLPHLPGVNGLKQEVKRPKHSVKKLKIFTGLTYKPPLSFTATSGV